MMFNNMVHKYAGWGSGKLQRPALIPVFVFCCCAAAASATVCTAAAVDARV
jgi:hypothetical protein